MHAFLKKNKGFFSPMSPEQLPGVYLCKAGKEFRRVCFIGATAQTRRKIMYEMDLDVPFQYFFLNDTEKAKEWLLP